MPDPLRPCPIFTGGSAIPRKVGQPMPTLGYGVVAVESASPDSDEHSQGNVAFESMRQRDAWWCCQCAIVKTTTHNVGELLAFTPGVAWAGYHPIAQQQPGTARPVYMRYDSEREWDSEEVHAYTQ